MHASLRTETHSSSAPRTALTADAPARPWVSVPLLGALLVFVTGTMSPSVLSDPDSYWHVAVGRWMVEQRQLPTHDMFSYSAPGVAWTAHEWLSELAIYGAFHTAGFAGLTILVSACFALTAGYLLRFLFDRLEPVHAIPVAAVFLAVISTHFLARPHVLVWPLTAIWVGELVNAGESQRRPPWWLLLVLLAWTNLHASFTLGMGLAAALAADAILQRDSMAEKIATLKQWLPFGIGCALAVLCNPHGFDALRHALYVMRMKETLALINEWKSANFQEFQMLLLWLAMVLGLALTGRLRLSPVRIVMTVGLLYLALKHQRYHATLGLISAFLLATPIANGLRRTPIDRGRNDVAGLDRLLATLAGPSRAVGVALVGVLAVLWVMLAPGAIAAAPVRANTPEKALAAFQATGIKANVLNAYGFGGYLIYRQVPVFIDGRADMYGDPFVTAAADAVMLQSPGALEKLIERYHVGWTLLGPQSPAVELLDHLPQWERVYSDSVAVLHIRRDLLHPTPTAR